MQRPAFDRDVERRLYESWRVVQVQIKSVRRSNRCVLTLVSNRTTEGRDQLFYAISLRNFEITTAAVIINRLHQLINNKWDTHRACSSVHSTESVHSNCVVLFRNRYFLQRIFERDTDASKRYAHTLIAHDRIASRVHWTIQIPKSMHSER